MLKEIKYLIFIVVIALFIFLTGRYYFSDENKITPHGLYFFKKVISLFDNVDDFIPTIKALLFLIII